MYEVSIITDSISPKGVRLTTFVCTYPRIVLAEINTHRVLSRNSASSRAVPVSKMRERIESDPFIPMLWPHNGKGMQPAGYEDNPDVIANNRRVWLEARNAAKIWNKTLEYEGVHKQIVNRLIEPWMWVTSVISATEWKNFFKLRCHPEAQLEFQILAYLMLKTYLRVKPTPLQVGDWHIPFGCSTAVGTPHGVRLKVATGRAARVSYFNHFGEIKIEDDITLHDRVMTSGHWSPFEHSAQCLDDDIFYGNFKSWKQYRKFIPGEEGDCDLNEVLAKYESSETYSKLSQTELFRDTSESD